MTMIKLDSGDYINTMYVIKTMTDTAGSVGKKNGQLVYLLDTGYQKITPADRIVEAMDEELAYVAVDAREVALLVEAKLHSGRRTAS